MTFPLLKAGEPPLKNSDQRNLVARSGELDTTREGVWILASEQMPPERIRVYAAYGTCVYEDVFYGWSNSDPALGWRYTHNEEPLVHTPTHWMPHPPIPKAPALTKELWSFEWRDDSGAWHTAWHEHSANYSAEFHGHRNLRQWSAHLVQAPLTPPPKKS